MKRIRSLLARLADLFRGHETRQIEAYQEPQRKEPKQ
jgi:hypothetical protein